MAASRLLFDKLNVYSDSYSTLSFAVSGITVDGLEISKEALTVAIENGQTLNEAFTGSITLRTINDTIDGAATKITAESLVSNDGQVPTECYIELQSSGDSDTFDLQMGPVYLMGYEDFSNSRVETVLTATKTTAGQGVISETAAS